MRAVIAAAGTGGHINPGLAIANKIKKEEPDSKILFIGTDRGLEGDLVPRSGYELKMIDSYGINRSLNIENIKRLYRTIKSIKQAEKILKKFKPDIVIGTGGYICISVCQAAKKLNIPFVLHESNAFPGVAVKTLAKKANEILIGFNEAKGRLKNARKVVVTGTPTKIKKKEFSKEEIEYKKKELGLNDKPVVLTFGGSQGAKSINKSLINILKKELNEDYQIIWATGGEQFNKVKKELLEEGKDINNLKNAVVLPYIYNMEEIMNLSDLVVSRSGAMTVTEISNLGKPAIFIPFPHAAENHQEYNARVLEGVRAAKVILDKDLTEKTLNNQIEELIKDPETLKKMGERSKTISISNVEEKIYQEIQNIIKR